MKKENYDLLMQREIKALSNKRAKLLLHSCCAPCSSACLERLKEHFDVTVYFYNPNMDTEKEFLLREKEQERLCKYLDIKCLISSYNKEEFLSSVKGLENAPEGGARCEKCFYLRLKNTALNAKNNGYDYFATTLTVSPLKNAQIINSIGQRIQEECQIKYLPTDFKKRGGYQRSIELSALYKLYRQNYCGCEFSKNFVPNELKDKI